MGIEPTYSAWKADVLPLNYTRNMKFKSIKWRSRRDSDAHDALGSALLTGRELL